MRIKREKRDGVEKVGGIKVKRETEEKKKKKR